MLPSRIDVSISHFPLMLFEISKLIKYYERKQSHRAKCCFVSELPVQPPRSPSVCSPLPPPLGEALLYKLQAFSFPSRFLTRGLGMQPPDGRCAFTSSWLARGMACQRDEGRGSRRIYFVSNKTTTPCLLNKQHFTVIANIYWVLLMDHTQCERSPCESPSSHNPRRQGSIIISVLWLGIPRLTTIT